MNKKSTVDLIHGPILPSLISFALPILLSNIFQQLYNTADILIVGRFLGQNSLAAVGATTAIFDLIIGFALGVGNGMGVVIARLYGARNFTKIKEAVAATWILGAILSGLVMLMGFFGLYPLLQYLETPAEILPQSYEYISMIVSCVGVSFAYNLFAGLLRSIGDSLAALAFLIFSAIVNVILDLYFITQLQLGVQSAGLATIISQGLSAILCYFYIRKSVPELLPELKHFRWNKDLYVDLLEQGLAMGLMGSIVSVGSVILQSSVNGFGAVIISAQTAARRIMAFALLPMTAISASMTTFISQNFGAKRPDRIVQGLRLGSYLSMAWATFACVFLFFASPSLVSFLASSTDGYLIESNHDVEILRAGSYAWRLKQRILSDLGHLSNEDGADAMIRTLGNRTKKIYLGHLSKENNIKELAHMTMVNQLAQADLGVGVDFQVYDTSPDTATPLTDI